MHIHIDSIGKSVRVVSLQPGQSIRGVIIGSGPQVTLQSRETDPGEESISVPMDTLLIKIEGSSRELVALISNDRLNVNLSEMASIYSLDHSEVTITDYQITGLTAIGDATSDVRWFVARPSRIETCPTCQGSGKHRRDYTLVPADHVVDAPNDAIRAMIVGSSDVFEACREAADIAERSGEPVAFRCREHTIVVRPGDDPTAAARQWWLAEHGETPEQTMANG